MCTFSNYKGKFRGIHVKRNWISVCLVVLLVFLSSITVSADDDSDKIGLVPDEGGVVVLTGEQAERNQRILAQKNKELTEFAINTFFDEQRLKTVTQPSLQKGDTPVFNLNTAYLKMYANAPDFLKDGHSVSCSRSLSNGTLEGSYIMVVDLSYCQPSGSVYLESFNDFSKAVYSMKK